MFRNRFFLFSLTSLFVLLSFPKAVIAQDHHVDSAVHEETAADSHEEKSFNFGDMILHHVMDDYQWHFFDFHNFHATLYLPVIVYSSESGLSIFSSKKLSHGESYKGYVLDHGHLSSVEGHSIIDVSITKNVLAMLLAVALLFILFISIARAYKKNPVGTPRGMQSFMEPLILFVRDEVAEPTLGHKASRYLPFLLTVFFFIWMNNMMGLLPGAANVTGNIAVTLVLAVFTFLITNFSGNKNYWRHIFAPPGIPFWLLPIMWVVEILGVFTKPFALMVRLFANINAGHMIILSIIGLIFVFGQLNAGLGYGMSLISIAFTLFMFFLELLVAAIQAYIFTILSALFISQAVEEHH